MMVMAAKSKAVMAAKSKARLAPRAARNGCDCGVAAVRSTGGGCGGWRESKRVVSSASAERVERGA